MGKRKTFSLASPVRAQAAEEARRLYQTIVAEGWSSLELSPRARFMPDSAVAPAKSTAEQWKRRLTHRKHLEEPGRPAQREFSVRIEHDGASRYFPLGTDDETQAAAQARRIHQAVARQGWAKATQRFSSELTVAVRWLDAPVLWTYTTILTLSGNKPAAGWNSIPDALNVAIVERDPGIRFALGSCVNHPKGFRCCATCPNPGMALHELSRQEPDLILINYDLAHQPGSSFLSQLRRVRPGVATLLYSVFEDSDRLFQGTPGGAVVYMLKRIHCFQILDPIAQALKKGSSTPSEVAASVRHYFQQAFSSLPLGPSSFELARLTPREHEILALLAKGELDKEIADSLHISIWTVHGHVKNIFEKLRVHTRTEAVLKYLHK